MELMSVACPHCHSAIQVESANVGIEASCPICSGGFIVPRFKQTETVRHQFACPHCAVAFQVADASLGQVVQCPGCREGVTLPTELAAGNGLQGISMDPQPPVVGDRRGSTQPAKKPATERRESLPKETTKGRAEVKLAEQKSKELATHIESLLPPKFLYQLPLATSRTASEKVLAGADIKTSRFVKVQIDGEEHLLRRLTPQELARRQLIRNVSMFGIGALLLIMLGWILRG